MSTATARPNLQIITPDDAPLGKPERLKPDPEQMLAALEYCFPLGSGLLEVRALKHLDKQYTPSRTEPCEKRDKLVSQALQWNKEGRNVYYCGNPVRPDYRDARGHAVCDTDIPRRIHMTMDFDSIKPDPDAPATLEQANKAFDAGVRVCKELHDGWKFPAPMSMFSGNGGQFRWAIDAPNDEATYDLIKSYYLACAEIWPEELIGAKIDHQMVNASRLSRFPGSINYKKFATAELPNRRAELRYVPSTPASITLDMMQVVIDYAVSTRSDSLQPDVFAMKATNGKSVRISDVYPDAKVAYIQAALAGELGKIASAPAGTRHLRVRSSATALGGFLHYGLVPRSEIESALVAAAKEIGLDEGESVGAVTWGLDFGDKLPQQRIIPERDADRSNGNGHAVTQKKKKTPAVAAEGGYNLTDMGNAERLRDLFGEDLRYVHPWKKWLHWDGKRWSIDNVAAVRRLGKRTIRAMIQEAIGSNEPGQERPTNSDLVEHALATEKRERFTAMLYHAEMELPLLPGDLNNDPWSFNCKNGTIDLRTGKLKSHDREDYISQLCNLEYDPDAQCPLWLKTINLFLAEDPDLIGYFQRLCGYALTGVIRDHILPVAYGLGANGKSTMLGTIMDVLGTDYAMKAPPDMLMSKQQEGHPTDRTDLFGKRLVVAIESEMGRRLNETMVKELTGGDKIRARRMREDFWEFDPTHTLLLVTNHKPVIRGTDNGIWRRLRLIPFKVQVTGDKADKAMPEKLRAEFPGILAWCVKGCLDWQAQGLAEPPCVTAATKEYRQEQDVIGAFLEEHTIIASVAKVKSGILYERYKRWAETTGEHVATCTAFGMAIQERGVEKRRSGGIWYHGIGLKPTDSDA